ncbi:SphA family protein [Brenneria izbisi]|uniref:Transporter n=1 Tax=Brenneria izbisi TaxID=2939450 RepID=A0AA42C192_9GAMM|nr:transporter [Brenneria izbisi]MCV9878632.1 transporter [Brenneria izbisi]MCV9882185.1 transporter [Brenneria izbisi]
MNNINRLIRITLLTSAIMAVPAVYGVENVTPLQPGATTGNAAGLLPPDGLYFSLASSYETGSLRDENGDKAQTPGGSVKLKVISSAASLLWVPGWEMLGARYGLSVVQPYRVIRAKTDNGLSTSTDNYDGLLNTTLTPLMLSWDLGNGLFMGFGAGISLKNGKFEYRYSETAGRNVMQGNSTANNFYIFQPNLAITYLRDDWAFTLNNIFNINTRNKTTDYQTGHLYYLDATATKAVDNWVLGMIGNYTRQFSDDEIQGQKVAAMPGFHKQGKRTEYAAVGPMVGYDFGTFSVSCRVLIALFAKNDVNMSMVHLGISLPLQ